MSRLGEVAALFLRIGCIGFGGPAAHIAMMEEEVVGRRRWLTREHFLDLVGATNLIPGPNSTEMAIHVGYRRAGFSGLLAAGAAFVTPALLLSAGFALVYVRFGALPHAAPFLAGIKPAVLAIIASAVWRLGRTALGNANLAGIGTAVILLTRVGVNEVAALFLGGIGGMLWLRRSSSKLVLPGASILSLAAWVVGKSVCVASHAVAAASSTGSQGEVSLTRLALFFLKVGAVLYGSGYVLVAFLEGGLVHDFGWLTREELLDAIAVGQFTPGPLLSTASFIGYLIAGWRGSFLSGVAIVIPSFLFVALLGPVIPRLRRSPWASAFLDAVNASAIGLMAAVALSLAESTLAGWDTWVILVAALLGTLVWRIGAPWLVLGGALLGWMLASLLGSA